MTSVLAGILGLVIYLDDVVVHGATRQIHGERLSKAFDALAKHHLTLNGDKCLFAVPKICVIQLASERHFSTTFQCGGLHPRANFASTSSFLFRNNWLLLKFSSLVFGHYSPSAAICGKINPGYGLKHVQRLCALSRPSVHRHQCLHISAPIAWSGHVKDGTCGRTDTPW